MKEQGDGRNNQDCVREWTDLHWAGKQIEDRAEHQEKRKEQIEYIREPSQTTHKVIITLRKSKFIFRIHPMCPWHERLPVLLEDLNTAKAPAEALLLQAFEVERHQASSKGAVDIHGLITQFQNTQTGFCIFGDAPF